MAERIRHDGVLIVGAGLAGLSAALAAAPRKALVLTGAALNHGCSSAWAQGGMAAALAAEDAPALHAADTVAAGAGLVDPAMAELLAAEGPDAVRRLADLGAPFDRNAEGGFAQSLEAAHSRARVARVKGDQPAARSCRRWPAPPSPPLTSRSARACACAGCCRTPSVGWWAWSSSATAGSSLRSPPRR